MVSPTRARFQEKRRAVREAKARDLWISEHSFDCMGERMRQGRLKRCRFEVRFSKLANGLDAKCNLCGQLHRHYGGKWFKAGQDYELGAYDLQKVEAKDREGQYEYDPPHKPTDNMPEYAAWETPAHEPDCGYKEVDLLGLTRRRQKTMAGPGVVKIGVAMVDRHNVVRHWCRQKKA